jgi:hypothetical protein
MKFQWPPLPATQRLQIIHTPNSPTHLRSQACKTKAPQRAQALGKNHLPSNPWPARSKKAPTVHHTRGAAAGSNSHHLASPPGPDIPNSVTDRHGRCNRLMYIPPPPPQHTLPLIHSPTRTPPSSETLCTRPPLPLPLLFPPAPALVINAYD